MKTHIYWLTIIVFLGLSACSAPKKPTTKPVVNYGWLTNLKIQDEGYKNPIVKVNNNLIFSNTMKLDAGEHKVLIKHYHNSSLPIKQTLNLQVNAGDCYQIKLAGNEFEIQPLTPCQLSK